MAAAPACRAQMLMLAVGVALFFPVLASGTLFGHPVAVGRAWPASSVLVGASRPASALQLGAAVLRVRHAVHRRRRQHADDRHARRHLSPARWWRPRTCRSGPPLPALKPLSMVTTLSAGAAIALEPGDFRGDRGADRHRRTAAARAPPVNEAGRAPPRVALAARAVAAFCRRASRLCCPISRRSRCRAVRGRDLGVRAMGAKALTALGRGRGELAVLGDPRERGAGLAAPAGYHDVTHA